MAFVRTVAWAEVNTVRITSDFLAHPSEFPADLLQDP